MTPQQKGGSLRSLYAFMLAAANIPPGVVAREPPALLLAALADMGGGERDIPPGTEIFYGR